MIQAVKTIFLDAISTYDKLFALIGRDKSVTGIFLWLLISPLFSDIIKFLHKITQSGNTVASMVSCLLMLIVIFSFIFFGSIITGLLYRIAVIRDLSSGLKINNKWIKNFLLVSWLGLFGHLLLIVLLILFFSLLLVPFKLAMPKFIFAMLPSLFVFFFYNIPALHLYLVTHAIEKPIKFFDSFCLLFTTYPLFFLIIPIYILSYIISALLNSGIDGTEFTRYFNFNIRDYGFSIYLCYALSSLWNCISTLVISIFAGSCYKYGSLMRN